MKSIEDFDLSERRVFVRVDFNVPLDTGGHITADARIRRCLSTIEYALSQGAKLILASHLGRPKGSVNTSLSLAPAASRLESLIEKNVTLATDCVGPQVRQTVDAMAPSEVVMLENLRFHSEEQNNDDVFGRQLASLCDVYINDAFAVSHRANASVVAITQYVAECGGGFLLQKELNFFDQAMTHPKRPLAAVVGGAKVSSKLAALQNMIERVDLILIGGAMANTFLKASGIDVGQSKVEPDLFDAARAIMESAASRKIKFLLPQDVIVAPALDGDAPVEVVIVDAIPTDQMALDIGPETTGAYLKALAEVKSVVWNGPMGAFEIESFAQGTRTMVNGIAALEALSIVGGGDTGVAIQKAGRANDFTYISTGGGAFLTLLEGKPLPAVAALIAAHERRDTTT